MPAHPLAIVGISVAIYLLSLFLDCFYIDEENSRAWSPGHALLLVGWILVFEGVLTWLANPLLFISWYQLGFKGNHATAFGFAVAALCLSLSFLFHRKITTSEAGGRSRISGYGPGYWAWNASILVMAVGSAVLMSAEASSATQ